MQNGRFSSVYGTAPPFIYSSVSMVRQSFMEGLTWICGMGDVLVIASCSVLFVFIFFDDLTPVSASNVPDHLCMTCGGVGSLRLTGM